MALRGDGCPTACQIEERDGHRRSPSHTMTQLCDVPYDVLTLVASSVDDVRAMALVCTALLRCAQPVVDARVSERVHYFAAMRTVCRVQRVLVDAAYRGSAKDAGRSPYRCCLCRENVREVGACAECVERTASAPWMRRAYHTVPLYVLVCL